MAIAPDAIPVPAIVAAPVASAAPVAVSPAISPQRLPSAASAAEGGRGGSPVNESNGNSAGNSPPDQDSAYLEIPHGDYPPMARRLEISGTVVLLLHISATGEVLEAKVRSGSGSDELDQDGQTCALRQRMRPRIHQGRAVESWHLARVVYQWHDDD